MGNIGIMRVWGDGLNMGDGYSRMWKKWGVEMGVACKVWGWTWGVYRRYGGRL